MPQFSEERTRNRFVLCDGKSNQGAKVALKRRNEIFNATALIHGATKPKKIPALDGMSDTLNKRCKLSDLRADVCKYRPEVGKIIFLKNPKKIMYTTLGILVMKI